MKAQIASKIITFISIGGCASFAVLDDPCRERGSCYFCVDVGSVLVPHTIFRLHLLLPADPSRAPGEILTASARDSKTRAIRRLERSARDANGRCRSWLQILLAEPSIDCDGGGVHNWVRGLGAFGLVFYTFGYAMRMQSCVCVCRLRSLALSLSLSLLLSRSLSLPRSRPPSLPFSLSLYLSLPEPCCCCRKKTIAEKKGGK